MSRASAPIDETRRLELIPTEVFAQLDIPEDQIHLPDGTVLREEVFAHCAGYEAAIEAAGGLDLQILGIGRTGHIGFNEPGSAPDSPTRLVTLDPVTRRDAARDFVGEENVPRHALTMGMGGTLHRLVDQGHEVTVVYLTAGDLAVPDGDALRISRIISGLHGAEEGGREAGNLITRVHEELQNKGEFDLDSADLRHLKSLIRREEACAASHQCGVDPESLVFLDLPFYQAGRYRSFAPGEIDVAALVELFKRVAPHQVYATGYLQDPNSVPGICFGLVSRALAECREDAWLAECRVWLYRGSEPEYEAIEAFHRYQP